MTADNTTPHNRPDVPDAAEPVFTQRAKTVSDPERSERAYRQAVERKIRIQQLEAQVKDLEGQIATITKERDDAVKTVEQVQSAYEEFTNENALQQRVIELERAAKYRDMLDTFNSLDGIEYQDGVTLDDLFQAAGVKFDELDEIPEDFTTTVIEAAKATKPFLFASSGSADTQPGEVRQNTDAQPSQQPFKAFGGQAAGGGAAPPSPKADPAQTVDWTDPKAINRFTAASK